MDNEKNTQNSNAVPQKEFVSFMVHNMVKSQRDKFQAFCDEKGFNYAPAMVFLLEFYKAFNEKNMEKGEEK
jgi:hypothetical protein